MNKRVNKFAFLIISLVGCLGLFVFCDGASINGKCNTSYTTKTYTYNDFYSNWFLRKGSSFCATGTTNYESLNCVSSSSNFDKCYYYCNGSQGGKTSSCYFNVTKENLCGLATGTSTSIAPSKDLCTSSAIASAVDDRKTSWQWSCRKYNGFLVSYCSSLKSCFKSGEFVSANQKCCPGLVFCPTSSTSMTGYCSVKCVGECSTSYEPVCGRDGRDYNNECMARRNGTTVDFEGECKYKGVKCGIASERTGYSLEDPISLCQYGKPSIVSGTGPWSWLCQKENSIAILCSSSKQGSIDGECGASNGKILKQIPTANLCNKGTPSIVKGDVVWNWTCGNNGGKLAYCYAGREGFKVNGACKSPSRLSSGFVDLGNLCQEGIPSEVAFSNDRWIWTCQGINNGTTASCSENYIFNSFIEEYQAGICGDINGTSVGEEPSKDFCKQGNLKNFYYNYERSSWTWNCVGSGGGRTDSCQVNYSQALIKTNGKCGSASTELTNTMPYSNLCEKGTAGSVTGTGPWYWTCQGISGGKDVKCNTSKAVARSGSCGLSSKRTYSSSPVNELCSNGLASAVSGNGPWYWTCYGTNGGSDVQCSAKISETLLPREETDKYLLVDLWVDENMKKGIRVSVKDYGVSVFMALTPPYKSGIGPEKRSDYELTKVAPADGWTDAYFYLLPESSKNNTFCFDAWYQADWINGKLSSTSQFYSQCIKLTVSNFTAPESMNVKLYPVLQGALALSLWTDSEESKDNPNNYSTIIVRSKGAIPIIPEKETTIANSVLGNCNLDNSCPEFDLVLGNNNKRIIAYLPRGKYCYTAWTRYCQGYFCNNSTNNLYWCFEIK